MDGGTPIAPQQVGQVAQRLFGQGQVEPELLAHLRQLGRRRPRTGPRRRGVTGQQPGDDERDEADAEGNEQRLEDAPDEDAAHDGSVGQGPAGSAPRVVGQVVHEDDLGVGRIVDEATDRRVEHPLVLLDVRA